ncbi:MAG: metal ABC transporter permease [Peptostreptococcaceae bacterium]|nr:metal ABC transporter permease [Peptostreptococcaceae bacterium]
MSPQFEIQLIAVIVAVSCALVGTFLVLTKKTMMSDSITHTILLGIVLAFFVTHDLSSPFLILGATLMGVATVWMTEALSRTRLLSEDAAIGVIFSLIFSIAIILITRYAGAVHLDTDSVLLGELAFAPFGRMKIAGIDIGAKAIYSTGFLLVMNVLAIVIFFKELKITTFDPMLASVLGFSPALVHYGLMTLVSITAVGSFQAVGSILVVAFMVGPAVTAYLITDDLKKMLLLGSGFGAFNAIAGYRLAAFFDVSIAGCMAIMTGITFAVVLIFGKERGLITVFRRRQKQRIDFARSALLFHLHHHEGKPNESIEAALATIDRHMSWDPVFTKKILGILSEEENVQIVDEVIKLTPQGRELSRQKYREIFGES